MHVDHDDCTLTAITELHKDNRYRNDLCDGLHPGIGHDALSSQEPSQSQYFDPLAVMVGEFARDFVPPQQRIEAIDRLYVLLREARAASQERPHEGRRLDWAEITEEHTNSEGTETTTEGREAVARWMIEHTYTTGHGDTLDDLLTELASQERPPIDVERLADSMMAHAEYVTRTDHLHAGCTFDCAPKIADEYARLSRSVGE